MVDGQAIRELCESYIREESVTRRVVIVTIEWGLFAALLLWGDFL
jgi:hypothetical protein